MRANHDLVVGSEDITGGDRLDAGRLGPAIGRRKRRQAEYNAEIGNDAVSDSHAITLSCSRRSDTEDSRLRTRSSSSDSLTATSPCVAGGPGKMRRRPEC